MTGLIVTWDKEEIQAVDESNFESIVVEVVDGFFESVEGYSNVEVEWASQSWDHGAQYKLHKPPVMEINKQRYYINVEGQSRGGKYEIDLSPDGLYVTKLSTEQTEELVYLTLRAPEVAVNAQTQEMFLTSIPTKIRERVVESLPDL